MSSSAQSSEQIELTPNQLGQCTEHYEVSGKFAVRRVVLPGGQEVITKIVIDPNVLEGEDAQSIFDYSFLRLKVKPEANFSEEIPSADLFSSCGCLSLGALEACNAIGKKFTPIVAIDKDPNSVAVYKDNFEPLKTYSADISALVDGAIGSKPTISELKLQQDCFGIGTSLSLLLAGPPCQGYSSLNNYHRQDDDRNILYERVARFVELNSPTSVLIENVPTVIHSKDNVVGKTIQLMEDKGYFVDNGIINLVDIGVPQLRKRHVVVASKRKKVSIKDVIEKHRVKSKRTFEWAAGDLQNEPSAGLLSIPTKHSEENKRRMAYLHDKQIYDLPNELRPQCHQKKHGYKSMYGRIKIGEPTQTITSGFTSPGQGRYTHPTKARTITPHEAARLQLIPDFFDFSKVTMRSSLSLMIGNAAPMKLAYVFCLELLT
jgi:DNA (cytosine-5)-methyltransferase 1